MRERAIEYHALLLIGARRDVAAGGRRTASSPCSSRSSCSRSASTSWWRWTSDELLSLEGGLKYLIVGAVGAALLLYGAALVYGATGQPRVRPASPGRPAASGDDALLLGGIALVIVGLGFKANAAPLHMWTPDAYEGAPTPVTAVHVGRDQGRRADRDHLRVLVTAFPDQSDAVEERAGRPGHRLVRDRQPRRPPPDQRQADAGLLDRRAHRLPADRGGRRQPEGRRGAALLPRRVRRDEHRRVRGRRGARAGDRPAGRDPGLQRVRLLAAGARRSR